LLYLKNVTEILRFEILPVDKVLGTVPFISYSIQEDFSFPLDRIFKTLH
jgi:hypothetical protein